MPPAAVDSRTYTLAEISWSGLAPMVRVDVNIGPLRLRSVYVVGREHEAVESVRADAERIGKALVPHNPHT